MAILRDVVESDLPVFFEHQREPESTAMADFPARDREAFDAHWRRILADDSLTKKTIVFEGQVAGNAVSWPQDGRQLVGYWLGKAFWGKGLMSEAAFAATRFAFDTLGLHKITIGCIDGNAASQRIIEKIGYRFLAKHEDDVWRDGRWWDHLRFELTASEWGDTARTMRFSKPHPT